MKDQGEADVILGNKITRSDKVISLAQSHYVEKILRKYNFFDCKCNTPFTQHHNITYKSELFINNEVLHYHFRHLIN